MESEEALKQLLVLAEEDFKDIPTEYIPRPDFWGAYVFRPTFYEFWKGKSNRLHDRLAFERNEGLWTITRLQP